jgi:hypothetical protein
LQNNAGLIDININFVFAAAEHPPKGSCEIKHSQQHKQKQHNRKRSQSAAPATVRMYDMLFYNSIGHRSSLHFRFGFNNYEDQNSNRNASQ